MRNLTNVPQDTVILTKQTGKFSEMERQIENKHGDGRIYRPSFLKPRERSKTTLRAHETVNHFGTKDFRSSLCHSNAHGHVQGEICSNNK